LAALLSESVHGDDQVVKIVRETYARISAKGGGTGLVVAEVEAQAEAAAARSKAQAEHRERESQERLQRVAEAERVRREQAEIVNTIVNLSEADRHRLKQQAMKSASPFLRRQWALVDPASSLPLAAAMHKLFIEEQDHGVLAQDSDRRTKA